ncbi:MAG TPA: SDR family oxidoreductase [Solirubrobacteraceae bacterium]|jgi:uronate dehydrogenase|nr:SDR family oxidoreductase [Solirubrobacteraceae bacterium]
MRTILITGSEGIIGSVLRRRLGEKYRIRGVDLPDDISHYEVLWAQMPGVDTVIHLAHRFSPTDPIERRMRIYPENVQIDVNVFTAVVKAGVKRLIMASSVHADHHRDPAAAEPFATPGSYHPATPYGVYKLVEEEVGKALSKQFGFEFVGVRFGGVTRDDSVKTGVGQTATWLSHDDLLSAIDACLRVESVPGRSTVFYAVSNNADRIHDTTNPFGWRPKDNSADRT